MTTNKAIRLIQSLCDIQYERYTYEQFLSIIKRRLRIFTGRTEVMWFSEIEIADLLLEMNVINDKKVDSNKLML